MSVNGQKFSAKRGDVLLDAALVNGIEIPHDCRAGQCGTCELRVLKGLTFGGDGGEAGTVRACQARVITDLELLVEPVPDIVTTRGIVTGLRPLAPDVVEVRISLAKPVEYLPGQYYKFRFRGFPARCFSPTAPMTPEKSDGGIRLHVRVVPGGRVSSSFGGQIAIGHPVRLEGPFGTAYLRPNLPNRLVLIGSGTGFAPIWAIAEAALLENPLRKIVMIPAAKTYESLYMGPAARRLRYHPGVIILPVADHAPPNVTVRRGRPTDHMPALTPDDIVYACGAPPMVEAIKAKAAEAGASFYADPFVAQGDDTYEGLLAWALDQLCHFGSPIARPLLEKPKQQQTEAQEAKPARRPRSPLRQQTEEAVPTAPPRQQARPPQRLALPAPDRVDMQPRAEDRPAPPPPARDPVGRPQPDLGPPMEIFPPLRAHSQRPQRRPTSLQEALDDVQAEETLPPPPPRPHRPQPHPRQLPPPPRAQHAEEARPRPMRQPQPPARPRPPQTPVDPESPHYAGAQLSDLIEFARQHGRIAK
ncbi:MULTISPECIES: 2Fe-2S iron-sulfur cluster binding domain-containing protein [Rhodomicrobium]|uniref:2Fe-2S iron-sulfur cluster binding domain-containing protein n=1 Tax=Rhodomicrobium TaxID=1068 RepID=UPI0014839366|nr:MULTISPECIES: 2Fe-2S iron-sulfur cluster binding domain-containing protein [Rhodomicrobium]